MEPNLSEATQFFQVFFLDRPIHSGVDINGLSCFSLTNVVYDVSTAYVKWAVNSKSFQEFLQQKEQFDVVLVLIFVGDALLSLGHYFNAPVIGISPHTANKWTRDLVGAPNLASFIPHTLAGYTDRMDFWQRAYNSLCYLYEDITDPLFYAPEQQKILDSLYPNVEKMPPLDVFRRNVSLVLYNALPGFEPPAPAQSNLIPVGGLSIDREFLPEPLPEDLDSFLEHPNGVIYIAFGSNVDFSHFDNDKQNAIIAALADYPEMRIILQSKVLTSIPSHDDSDVIIRPWLPQKSILVHENVKLFISHGGSLVYSFNLNLQRFKDYIAGFMFIFYLFSKGLLSTYETVHFAKPTIGISIFFDHKKNMKMAEQLGYGIHLPYEELNADKLRDAIKRIFTDPRFELIKKSN